MRYLSLIFLGLLFVSSSYAANTISDVDANQELSSQINKKNSSALDTVEEYEGESIAPGSTFDIGKTALKLTNLDRVKPPFFDGIDNNVIFSQAMLNTQQETGDPEFILLSRQNGLLKNDYLYLGGMASFTPVWGQNNKDGKNTNNINNYSLEYYMLSTLGEWTSVFTDKGVTKATDVSAAFNLRESFSASIFPGLQSNNFLSTGGNVYGWSSQLDYTLDLYNKDFVPYVSYSQIQQASDNYATIINSGFRYNAFSDAWIGFSYSYVKGQAESFSDQDNIFAMYLRIFI